MAFPYFHYKSHPDASQTLEPEPPFTIFIAHQNIQREGSWQPVAFIHLDKSLRTSGFLLALTPDSLKTLLMLLTFLTPNGHCAATLEQLATALHLSKGKARGRMEQLTTLRWLGQPIVLSYRAENGLETFVLAPGFAPVNEADTAPPPPPVMKAAPREIVIEHSRRMYGRPRAEVERQIAQINDWPLPETELSETELSETELPETPFSAHQPLVDQPSVMHAPLIENPSAPQDPQQNIVRRELLRAGLLPEQADDLLSRFDLVRIQRQLMWLPYRAVRNRAGFLLAAIKDDYAAPPQIRRAHIESEPQPSSLETTATESDESQG